MKKINYINEHLEFRSIRDLRLPLWTSVALNFISLIFIALIFIQERSVITKYKNVVVERLVEDMPLTDSAIVAELTQMGCVLPNVALAQFKVETGHFSSPICKENKNIGGIRTSQSKYVKGMNRGHCVYSTYRDCLRDYVLIQERYLKNINGKYAEAKDYIQTLKKIK